MEFSHEPVMAVECIEGLNIKGDGTYADFTTGGGGHSVLIAQRLTSGRLICFDRDEDALAAAKKRLSEHSGKIIFVKSNFEDLAERLDELGIVGIDGALFDLGTSSWQLNNSSRGFAYMGDDAPLDMRMDRQSGLTARDVVNELSEQKLREIFYTLGEERYAARVAAEIVRQREVKPIETTLELVEIIKRAMPAAARREKQHPAKRVFMAIRIFVNDELSAIDKALNSALERLNPGGRCSVVSFHSLEDRLAKQIFAAWAAGCTCSKKIPVCICGGKPKIRLITKGAVAASDEEVARNPRSRSAKLRIAEKL